MSEPAAVTQSTDIDPMTDLEGWTVQRASELTADAKTETEAQPSEPAAEPPAPPVVEATTTPEEKKVSWRELPLDDVDDEFLKGKPAGELLKSYKASVAAMQKAQREANDAKSEVQRIKAEAEARTVPAPTQVAKPDEPQEDEIDRLIFEDTPKGRKMLEDRMEEKSRTIAREEYQKSAQETAEREWKQAAANASIMATQKIAQLYGWSEEEAIMRMKTAFPLINDFVPQYGPQLWTNEDVYVGAIQRLYGNPASAQAPAEEPATEPTPAPTKASPTAPNPPGSGRPAPVAVTPTKAASALSREQQDARRILAEQVIARVPDVKFDVDEFARGNKRRGTNA